MRLSKFFLNTLKEVPAEAELVSHKLMLRAGLIRKLASGLYTWLPLGLRVMRKVEAIVRSEMNKADALEILMPAVQPAELWEESTRWQDYGPELLRLKDRHERDFCFGPTHEEVVTDVVRREIKSYKQVPVNLYQIQTKFRDEIRPRFGVMRAREFVMKDAYSFDVDEAGMRVSYQKMFDAYMRIFTRLGLQFRPVLADTGAIGGRYSHEFQVLAASGEDCVVYSDGSDYAANIEKAEALPPQGARPLPTKSMTKVATPGAKTIEDVARYLQVPVETTIKTLIVKGTETPWVALVLRGDHACNTVKVEKLQQVAVPMAFADAEAIHAEVGCGAGSWGPLGLTMPVIVDREAAHLADFVAGANEDGFHYTNMNWERDVPLGIVADIRDVVEGDLSPDGKGILKFARGIEVGHVFQLGTRYSEAMQAMITDEKGQLIPLQMGCYGIGVSRIVAAAIEQNYDDRGIIWSDTMAPFTVALVTLGEKRSEKVLHVAEQLYQSLTDAGYEVLWDDRDDRPGVKFADIDLIGIPHRLVVSERGLETDTIEYKHRRHDAMERWQVSEVINRLRVVCHEHH